MTTFSIRITKELNDELTRISIKEDRSRNYLIIKAIEEYIKTNKD